MTKKLLINLFVGILLLFYVKAFVYSEENYPQRIISLGPAITEGIYLLKAEEDLLANTIYCQKPKEAKNKVKVGTVIELNLEKIIALCPDLILATSLTNPKQVEKLRSLGLRIVVFPAAKSYLELCQEFIKLAELVGKRERAESLIEQAQKKVWSIREKTANLAKPKVFIQIGANPLYTVTGDSFINDYIEFAGGINIAKDAKTGIYSREKVLEINPDVIIIVTMGITEEEKRTWMKFKTLSAVKNNRVYVIDSYKISSPTPLSFAKTLEEITGILHPEIKR